MADDEFDDEELLELAQAGMSQSSPLKAKPTSTATANQAAAHIPNAAESKGLQLTTADQARPLQHSIENQQPAKAQAAEDDYVELDDDELLELACASMDPQQEIAGPQSIGTRAQDMPSARKASQISVGGKGICVCFPLCSLSCFDARL